MPVVCSLGFRSLDAPPCFLPAFRFFPSYTCSVLSWAHVFCVLSPFFYALFLCLRIFSWRGLHLCGVCRLTRGHTDRRTVNSSTSPRHRREEIEEKSSLRERKWSKIADFSYLHCPSCRHRCCLGLAGRPHSLPAVSIMDPAAPGCAAEMFTHT